MGRGARTLVLLVTLLAGLALLLGRQPEYRATATAGAVDAGAAQRVAERAEAPGFRTQVATALSADPASAIPPLSAAVDGQRVLVTARDVDPERARDTVDTAVLLLDRGSTADLVERTRTATPPTSPEGRPSLLLLALVAAAALVVALAGSLAARLVRGRR
ncbi:hypothetical protein [Arthrobacter sp. NEB 688]|uniref:hypothetical protein n=1 Tax=Arthrobacter sp. NEB 688 TaxID=904039 RepID=UPI001566CD01|nr:hypothetical protein [Arthrobacter sp. NEB 688]QKE83545.1 hypothetical protein HL663_06040 [Arthrobacter sp. NEB 688]